MQLSWQFNRRYKWRTVVRVRWSASCTFRCENFSLKFNHRVQQRSLAEIKPAFPKRTTLLKRKFLSARSFPSRNENNRVQNFQPDSLGWEYYINKNKTKLMPKLDVDWKIYFSLISVLVSVFSYYIFKLSQLISSCQFYCHKSFFKKFDETPYDFSKRCAIVKKLKYFAEKEEYDRCPRRTYRTNVRAIFSTRCAFALNPKQCFRVGIFFAKRLLARR